MGNAASRTSPDAGGEPKANWLQVEVVGKTGPRPNVAEEGKREAQAVQGQAQVRNDRERYRVRRPFGPKRVSLWSGGFCTDMSAEIFDLRPDRVDKQVSH